MQVFNLIVTLISSLITCIGLMYAFWGECRTSFIKIFSFFLNPTTNLEFDFHMKCPEIGTIDDLISKLKKIESDYKKIHSKSDDGAIVQVGPMTLMVDLDYIRNEVSITATAIETTYRKSKEKVNSIYQALQEFHELVSPNNRLEGWGTFKLRFSKNKNPYFKLFISTPYKLESANIVIKHKKDTSISISQNTITISGSLEKLLVASVGII